VRRLAVERVNAAGYHLDLLRPSRARALEEALRLPPIDLLPLYEQNLLSEYHLRYGGWGGIGY
jgi:hypothetical protein